MKNRVLIIGIDALDATTLFKHRSELPYFSKLIENTPINTFDGVFPPDSPTSWASIYTGLNPAKHGIVLFTDPLKRVSTMVSKDVDDTSIRGRTFWDIAGKMGKKVCIMPHLLGYPVWPVNGVMIGRSGVTPDVQVYPEDISHEYYMSEFMWDLKLFPGRNKAGYIKCAQAQLQREQDFALQLFSKNEWDIFFISFGELDPIQYSFWNFYDTCDPSYPGENPYQDVIVDFYKAYDRIIGTFWALKETNTAIIVVSDHGIGSRPVRLFNVNEFLRRNDLLQLNNKQPNSSKTTTVPRIAKVKQWLLLLIDRYDLGNYAAKGLKIFPMGKEMFISAPHIDWNRSTAYLTDQSGIKNYPYGGIIVNGQSQGEYETIRDLIIQELSHVKDPDSGEKVVKWICKREDLYSGEYIDSYPDILFEFNSAYGAGATTPAEIFGESLTHNIAPGCHKQHHATFLISDYGDRDVREQGMSLIDVTPTVLDLLGIEWKRFEFDGKSIFIE